jgi:hypothetical protein
VLGGFLNQAVMVAGIVIAVVRWRRHPRTSRLVIVALALPLAVTLLIPLWLPSLEQWLEHLPAARRSLVISLDSTLWKMARAASYVLLLVVTLGPRRDRRREDSQTGDLSKAD